MARGLAQCNRIAAAALLAAAVWLGGCGVLKVPDPPTPITTPEATVESVRLTQRGPEATRYELVVGLSNPNDFALPLEHAEYEMTVADQRYEGDAVPNRTLPASGSISVPLPVVIEGGRGGDRYEASGSIRLVPPGQIRRLMYEMGIPKPIARFSASGAVDVSAAADATSGSESASSDAQDGAGDASASGAEQAGGA